MNSNDQIEVHLRRAVESIETIDFAVKTDAIRPVDFQEQMGRAASAMSDLATALSKLNDQMRPLAQFSALIKAAEKLQDLARQAAAAELEADAEPLRNWVVTVQAPNGQTFQRFPQARSEEEAAGIVKRGISALSAIIGVRVNDAKGEWDDKGDNS